MVYDFVEERQGLDLLRDKRVMAATTDIAGIAMSKSEVRQTPLPISETELYTEAVNRHYFSHQSLVSQIDSPSSR